MQLTRELTLLQAISVVGGVVPNADAEKGSKESETFKIMEQRLLRIITNPAMVVSWALGLWLAFRGPADPEYGWFASGWLWAKLSLALGRLLAFCSSMPSANFIALRDTSSPLRS